MISTAGRWPKPARLPKPESAKTCLSRSVRMSSQLAINCSFAVFYVDVHRKAPAMSSSPPRTERSQSVGLLSFSLSIKVGTPDLNSVTSIKNIFLLGVVGPLLCAGAARGAEQRYTLHTSGLNSSVYVNMLYFANLVNQYATDFTLFTLASEGGPSNMISVNDGRGAFGTSTAESVKEAYDGTGDFEGRPQKRIRHVASF